MEKYLTVAEAANSLSVTRQRIRQLCGDSILEIKPIDSRTYLVGQSSVERYKKNRPKPGRKPKNNSS